MSAWRWWCGIPDSTRSLWESRFWIVFAVPMILWWRESVFLVAIMSLYANYKTAHTDYEAAKAKEAVEEG